MRRDAHTIRFAGRPRPRRSAWRQGIGSPRLKDRRVAPCGPVWRKPSRLAALRRLRAARQSRSASRAARRLALAGGTGRANFRDPRRKGTRSAAECSLPWKRSFCSLEPDRNGTVSCRGHRPPGFSYPRLRVRPARLFSHAPGLDTGAGLGFPERLRASGPRPYLEIRPSPREGPGNTKTGRRLGQRPLPGRVAIPTGPVWQGWGLSPRGSRQGYGL